MLTGLALLKERCMDIAAIGTSEENIAMIHTAESVGFRIKNKVLRFSKTIHFGQDGKR
jgi:predicted metallo-beta-lactamase superfamily hydrolase